MTKMAEKAQAIAFKERIQALENQMRDLPQVDLEVNHYFAHGTYTRELIIPAGVMLTGKIHLFSTVNILSQGKMKIATSEGMKVVEAPYTFVSAPGEKKVGVALEDSVFINVFPWDGIDDTEAIVEKYTVASYENLEKRLEGMKCQSLQQQ